MAEWRYWRLDPKTTTTHAFGARSVGNVCLGAEESDYIRAYVKWDGCTIVDDQRTLPYHLCDLTDEIGRWQELHFLARAYFGGEFCIGGNDEVFVRAFIAERQAADSQRN